MEQKQREIRKGDKDAGNDGEGQHRQGNKAVQITTADNYGGSRPSHKLASYNNGVEIAAQQSPVFGRAVFCLVQSPSASIAIVAGGR